MSSFLELPVELRLIVYRLFLSELQHVGAGQQQPTNRHHRILQVCRQMSYEAGQLADFRSYVSLIHEDQIVAFNANINAKAALQITTADVANDSRMVDASGYSVPASQLYLALSKLLSLRNLRVFNADRSRPMKDFVLGAKFTLQFEKAMFPSGRTPHLNSYELYLSPFKSSIRIFQVLSPTNVQRLRLSGECGIPQGTTLPSLTHLSINGVTGHYLDQHMEQCFAQSRLETLQYRQVEKSGAKAGARFELRDRHLKSLVLGSASRLRKLVLMGCSHLSSSVLSSCLEKLECLRYFALSVSVHELDINFVMALPSSLVMIKLGVTTAWYATPRLEEEHQFCEAFEDLVVLRTPSYERVYVDFRDEVLTAMERRTRWARVAQERNFALHLGAWDEDEIF